MSKIIKTLRNNWKKTMVACIAVVYGYDFAETEYKKNLMLRKYCLEVVKFGEVALPVIESPRHVVVILNPAANKRKAKKEYEKYCAPLLHLSGVAVTLFNTNEESDATNLTNKIDDRVDAVVAAGGDGTVSEVVTGLLRQRNDSILNKKIPLGIIPVGKTNSLATRLYSSDGKETNEKLKRLQLMLDATYSIINEITNSLHVMEIENLDKDENQNSKPVYAVSNINWGAFRNVRSNEDKYWYFGKLRSFASYVFGSYDVNAPVKANLRYSTPCSGCASCYKNRTDLVQNENKENKSWWHIFIPRFTSVPRNQEVFIDYEKIENKFCNVMNEISIKTTDFNVIPEVTDDVPSLRIDVGPENISYTNFVKEGWSRVNGTNLIESEYNKYYAQTLYIIPPNDELKDNAWLSIDNEDYEVKNMKVTLLHNVLSIFYPSTPPTYNVSKT